jgi:hypothetical protein
MVVPVLPKSKKEADRASVIYCYVLADSTAPNQKKSIPFRAQIGSF